MDDRKRTLVKEDTTSEQMKRLRPEDILGMAKEEPNRVATRLVLNKSQFSKVIGKAGQMIASIRSASGTTMRGVDLDADNRMVLIVGTLVQVVVAFDLVVQQVLRGVGPAPFSPATNTAYGVSTRDSVAVTMLVEHSKAGKVVGAKGAHLQLLRQKSGATVTVEKDPIELSGVALRRVSLEGSASAVRWAHYMIQELFADPQAAALALRYLSNGVPSSQQSPGMAAEGTTTEQIQPGAGSAVNNGVGVADLMAMATFNCSLPAPGLVPSSSMHPHQQQLQQQQYNQQQRGTPGEMSVVGTPAPRQPPMHMQQLHQLHQVHPFQHGRPLPPHPVYQQLPSPYQQVQYGGHSACSPSTQLAPVSAPYLSQEYPYGSNAGALALVQWTQPGAQQHQHQQQQQQQHSSYPGAPPHHSSARANNPYNMQGGYVLQDLVARYNDDGSVCSDGAQSVDAKVSDPQESYIGGGNGHTRDPVRGTTSSADRNRQQQQHPTQSPPPLQQHIAMSSLRSFGVPAEVVGQLVDLQAYLLRSCGLVLSITREETEHVNGEGSTHYSPPNTGRSTTSNAEPSPGHAEQSGRSAEGIIALRRAANPHDVYFPVPCSCVGGIIGKGGRTLRDLQNEFGVRVFVEKEEYMGQRIVSLSFTGAGAGQAAGASTARGVPCASSTAVPGRDSPQSPSEELGRLNRLNSVSRDEEVVGGLGRGQFLETAAHKQAHRGRHNSHVGSGRGGSGSGYCYGDERSRSGSVSLGALDRDLQIEDESGADGDGLLGEGLGGETEVETELHDKFLELGSIGSSRGSTFTSINAPRVGDESLHSAGFFDTRAKTKRPASASDADSEYTASSVSTKGRVKTAGAAKHKRNRTDVSGAVAAATLGPRSPKVPMPVAAESTQGSQVRNKSKRGYASEGEEGYGGGELGGEGDDGRKDNRKSLRTTASSGIGLVSEPLVLPPSNSGIVQMSLGGKEAVRAASASPVVSDGSPSGLSVHPDSSSQVQSAKRRLTALKGQDLLDEGDVTSGAADWIARQRSSSGSGDEGGGGHSTDGGGSDGEGEGAAEGRYDGVPSLDLESCSRSKRKRNCEEHHGLASLTSAGARSAAQPQSHQTAEPPSSSLSLVRVGGPTAPTSSEAQAAALQRCRERIEAMMEDILQRQVRDVGNNDLYCLHFANPALTY